MVWRLHHHVDLDLVWPWSNESWTSYCHFTGISLPVFFAVVTAIWFTWGGLKDMRALFQRLRHQKINVLDDGTVVGSTNLDELQPTTVLETGNNSGGIIALTHSTND